MESQTLKYKGGGYSQPLPLHGLKAGFGSGVVLVVHPTGHYGPQIFNGGKVGGVGWPWEDLCLSLPEELLHNTCFMDGGIVVLPHPREAPLALSKGGPLTGSKQGKEFPQHLDIAFPV